MTRSLRTRLVLLFCGILVAAIAIVYTYVVPQLESSLRTDKQRVLANAASAYSGRLVQAIGSNLDVNHVRQTVREAADRSGARVTLLGVSSGTQGLQTYPISDSAARSSLGDMQFQVAHDAAQRGRTVTGAESGDSGRVAEAARPLFFNGRVARVVIFSAPLADVQSNVAVVRRRVLVAGGIALILGVLAAYMVAAALSRRVKRLERAAEQVAAGDFSQSIPIESEDEIGQLAVAFNEMQRQLAQLDSARKRFIAIASHELRTPIFSLSGFVELLEDEDLDDETRAHFLRQIAEQTERLRRLSTELLDLSKLEAGSLELNPERTDIGALARAVSSEFEPALAQHHSRLELRVATDGDEVLCDADRVAQIMRILLDNALTHTPPGTAVEVVAQRANGRVVIAVQDHGLGIKRGALTRVFEPFYTTDDAEGSGLGLAIGRELAERMDGHLAVESVPGRTTFTLDLPA
ncbi:MAG TPA: HAMP domain-containing sensor histidine kinase [Solirubrobacteraceae bacterium]|nr:HAMP domain-containing sensor histidine kinase [Solirubrobacteraceae bacterium]